jgi:hydrophobe/amphiphile efflux-3 (HAE3) family protein
VLLALVGITAVALLQIADPETGEIRLEIDPSENRLLPEDDEGRKFYDYIRLAFGNDETMIVAVRADDLFTTEVLSTIRALTEKLGEVEGVHHVTSLTNAVDMLGTEYGFDVSPFIDEIPTDPAELARLRERLLDNPIYAGSLLSRDAKTTALVIQFLNFSDREFINSGTDDRIVEIANSARGVEVFVTGGPHIKVAQVRYQQDDLRRSLPIILAALGLVLGLSFRTVRGVVLPLLSIVVALIWTMGIAAAMDEPLNLVTSLVPALMLILGLSYAVHVVSEYYDVAREKPGVSSRELNYQALRLVAQPVTLTAITTAAGFLALGLSPIGAIGEFGMLALVGVIASALVSLTLVPVVLSLLPPPRRLRSNSSGPFARAAAVLGDFDLTHSRGIRIAYVGVFLLACYFSTQLEVGGNSIKTFPESAPVRSDFEAVNRYLDGANPFNIVLKADGRRAFHDPANLRVMEKFQAWLVSQPEIGGTTSMVDFVKLINRGFHENDAEYLRIPKSKRLTSQLLFFGSSDDLEGFVDARGQLANINVRANVIDRAKMIELVERIEARIVELPEHLTATVTGNPILKNRLANSIAIGQASSMIYALGFIYVILVINFLGNPHTALIALLPNALVIAVFFGALGASGVSLNLATSVIGPMALGVAIDDTIHYFVRFTQDAKAFADERRATASALVHVGRPVTYTTIAICTGFLILTTSDLLSQIQVGALGAFTLAFAWLVDVTLTPALCAGLRVVTLWDTLSLDLGKEPQLTIDMFMGLTKTQCRVVAQMATLRQVNAGQRLMRTGDEGQEVYVIIDGTLEASVERPEGRMLLRTMRRGDVIGEVGLFYRSGRSADIDVVEDSVLLRLTQNNMERLTRRYPRTAARIFRNLGTTLAGRLVDTTRRL